VNEPVPEPAPGRAAAGAAEAAGAPAAGDGYLLDNRLDGADIRLAAIAELFDPVTFRHLDATGVTEGWRCWEVGAGGPSVSAWLAGRVGPDGSVVATDLDLSRFGEPPTGVTAIVHDVTSDPPPGGPFDLIHARLVLVHLPERDAVMTTLVAALRPGGWLVLEDADPMLQPLACIDERGPDEVLANKVRAGFRALLADRGADLAFGRTLPARMRAAGIVDVTADAWFPVTDPVSAVLERVTVEQMREGLVVAGLASGAEVDGHLANIDAGRLDLTTAPLVSARGRRPDTVDG
jgi:SAM-dependent methyltransferase